MALIKCPECQKEVSDQASICPHCGVAISGDQKVNYVKIAIIVVVCVALVAGAVVGFLYYRQRQTALEFLNNMGYRVALKDDYSCYERDMYIELSNIRKNLSIEDERSDGFFEERRKMRCISLPEGLRVKVIIKSEPAKILVNLGDDEYREMWTSFANLSKL